ncbi:hypothetical protein AAFF_G00344470 [Aldrovandia affinis]|uniref:Uncharacterized protein n=1 Tax=Aldrovandia affinis TaxID=143900 RepID=A0AAD7WP40_9TELE|nr:hypothetical protein AAFF_G00344470 [Aldrovandia affinis]
MSFHPPTNTVSPLLPSGNPSPSWTLGLTSRGCCLRGRLEKTPEEVHGGDGIRTFDPGGTLPEWTCWLSWWPLDMCRSALPRSELKRRVYGIPRGRTGK